MKDNVNLLYRFYSIIVPSFNRRDEIQELLESFVALDFDSSRVELIIADDGSQDDTASLIKEYQKKLAFTLRFYSQPNRGPGAARNMGMQHANGDFFVFIDSDCTVPPNWLKNIDQGLNQTHAQAFGGRDSFRKDFPDLLKAINYSMTSFITTGGLRGRKGKKLAKFYPRSFNMGLSKSLYKKIGGFGSLRHGQDIEYSHRMIQSGAKIIYIDSAIVYHKRRTNIRKFFRQVFNWGVARINLYNIDPSMMELLHIVPAMATLSLFSLLLWSILFPSAWKFTAVILVIGLSILIISGIHAAFIYRRFNLLILVPIIMPIQIVGYGLGFITGYIYRNLLGKSEFTGFKKRYY